MLLLSLIAPAGFPVHLGWSNASCLQVPLCPTSVSLHGPVPFWNAFPLVHLAPSHSSFRIPLWEALLFTRHVDCLSSGRTLYITTSQSQGFPGWTMTIDYSSVRHPHPPPLHYTGSSVSQGLGLAQILNPRT